MGRHRTKAKHLPRRMQMRGRSYYYVARVDGKQRWIPLGTDYGDALRQWAKLEGNDTQPALTVADALAHYLDDRAPKRAAKTMKEYRAQAKTLGKVFGAMRLEDVKRSHVYTYLKKRGNVAGNRERDLLRAAYNHAANLGYEGGNPCQAMRYRNPEGGDRHYVTDDELAALMLAARPRLANLLMFLYLTGMRIGDAIALQLTAAQDDGIHWREGKKGTLRHVEWSDALREVWRQAAGARIGAQHAFYGQRGPYTLDGIESTFARVRKRAKLDAVKPAITLHSLRRKAASDLPLDQAQKLLGHIRPEVTRRHYVAKAEPVRPVK